MAIIAAPVAMTIGRHSHLNSFPAAIFGSLLRVAYLHIKAFPRFANSRGLNRDCKRSLAEAANNSTRRPRYSSLIFRLLASVCNAGIRCRFCFLFCFYPIYLSSHNGRAERERERWEDTWRVGKRSRKR